ncbi:hypothetical protein MASR1M32_32190 [Rhodobacter sp.]
MRKDPGGPDKRQHLVTGLRHDGTEEAAILSLIAKECIAERIDECEPLVLGGNGPAAFGRDDEREIFAVKLVVRDDAPLKKDRQRENGEGASLLSR